MTKHDYQFKQKYSEVSDIAIQMSSDRRVLIDFLYTVACSPQRSGSYTFSREQLQAKALDLVEDLGLD
jgi:hypothetical protein